MSEREDESLKKIKQIYKISIMHFRLNTYIEV